jgi:signal transduction histidine kinase
MGHEAADALYGAVGEALVNAGKHGHAHRATIYVEPTSTMGIFCSIKDDGDGFDLGATTEGFGITSSIRARIEAVGGTVEIWSSPSLGAEVKIVLEPRRRRRRVGRQRA